MNGALGRCAPVADAGVAVVTRFDCDTLPRLLRVRLMHQRLSRRIRAELPGLIATFVHTDVPARRILSVSLFGSIAELYQMGSVTAHIEAAHAIARLKVHTRGGIFPYSGDWRTVLFAVNGHESPLRDL